MARWPVTATAGGVAIRRGTAKAWRAVNAAGHAPTFVFISTIAKAGHPVTIIIFGAAPNAVAIFSEHPHVEGGVAIEIEMQGAPPAQATRAGKRLPAAGQSHVPSDGDL